MTGNTFGKLFCLTTYGESHGAAIGGVIEGCPAGLNLNLAQIQSELHRRMPGQSSISTQRKEKDEVEFLSGIFENITLGTPIGFIIRNKDAKAKDYDHLKHAYRPSHADNTYDVKYGQRDHRGGGRSSARETACRVVGGAIARQLLEKAGVEVTAYVSRIGAVELTQSYQSLNFKQIEENMVRCPDLMIAKKMIAHIEDVRSQGDSVGGIVTCVIKNTPKGLGEPVFDKLHADLAKAMLSINAVKGFEYGSGFKAASMTGSTHNDTFNSDLSTRTNHSGGIQGGISNGEDIYFNVAFKPVATIMKDQDSVNNRGESIVLKGKGRHDPCVVPRAVPIVEAMALLTMVDHLLRNRTCKVN